jgi:transposase
MLVGITKRDNKYVRKLHIHGARAVLKARMNKEAYAEDWAVKLAKRPGQHLPVPGRQVALPGRCELHDQWPVLHQIQWGVA